MKRLYNKTVLFILDALIIPMGVVCYWLTDRMLATDNPCIWTLLGGQCLTCGGTHFVNSLLSGHIAQAFVHNPFLFAVLLLVVVSWVLVHCHLLGQSQIAGKVLRRLFSIPTLIMLLTVMALFLLERNWPILVQLCEILKQNIR